MDVISFVLVVTLSIVLGLAGSRATLSVMLAFMTRYHPVANRVSAVPPKEAFTPQGHRRIESRLGRY